MTEEKSTSEPRGAELANRTIDKSVRRAGDYVGFVAFVFLFRSLYYLSIYFEERPLYPGEMLHQVVILAELLLAVFYLAAIVGFTFHRCFAYHLAWFLVSLDVIFSAGYILNPSTAIVGIPLTLLLIYFLRRSKLHFKPSDRIDKAILLLFILTLILYPVLILWASNQPTPGQITYMVAAEAIDKNDVKICDKITIGRDECIRNFAESKKEASFCALISSDYSKDLCYLHVADDLEDAELCKLIKGDYDKKMCEWVTAS